MICSAYSLLLPIFAFLSSSMNLYNYGTAPISPNTQLATTGPGGCAAAGSFTPTLPAPASSSTKYIFSHHIVGNTCEWTSVPLSFEFDCRLTFSSSRLLFSILRRPLHRCLLDGRLLLPSLFLVYEISEMLIIFLFHPLDVTMAYNSGVDAFALNLVRRLLLSRRVSVF